MFGSERQIKSGRKTYRCDYCDDLIPIGNCHIYFVGQYEGEFWTARFHNECFRAFDQTCEGELYPGAQTRGECWNGGGYGFCPL